jgi:hypothetical protein
VLDEALAEEVPASFGAASDGRVAEPSRWDDVSDAQQSVGGVPKTRDSGAAYPAAIVQGMTDEPAQTPTEHEERLVIPLDPEVALRALLEVDPDELVPQDEPVKDQGDALAD